MLTPIGVLGGIRGVFFANMGGAHFGEQPFRWWSRSPETYSPIIGFGPQGPEFGSPERVNGFRLVDARASYGLGLETFVIGFPVHFDWSWRTLLNKQWEDLLFAEPCNPGRGITTNCGGSAEFRKPQFSLWIGYDF